ncbi:heme oxygenase [Paenibacillus shirakamiensis]|uniref:Heme oxygenase n=1 Tax=Paenibacillus shirakamiensis TaxID=1265935 RepID=A0ABS4JI02_9BACL|nr:biliverdin-producing heme oxygenase [Paenibacillus shirakamiensis]MBP2001351.1 heme oxygenase [Paenibacillus shirakamiensis]
MSSTILTRLKEETAPYHIQTEQNRYATAITDRTLTMDLYREYLEKFYGFVQPIEDQFASWSAWNEFGFNYEVTRKTPLLHQDLIALGRTEEEIQALPICDELPDMSTFSKVIGVMYVLEGSTLGGQMITKLLKQYLPVDAEINGHYFNSYGAQTRAQWTEFRELLLKVADVEAKIEDEIVVSATNTFVQLDQWFKQ